MIDKKFYLEMINAYNKYDGKVAEIVNSLETTFPNIHRECIRSRVRNYVRKNESDYKDANDTIIASPDSDTVDCNNTNGIITKSIEYKSDGSAIFERIISLSSKEQLTPNNILCAHGMDDALWELISCKSNLYQQQKRGGEVLNLYQSKITVKPRCKQISIGDIKNLFSKLKGKNNFNSCIKTNNSCKKYLYEINIADLHLGKFSCYEETGDALNSNIAERRFIDIVNAECERLDKLADNVEQIIFVWTNDFFNSDGISNSTTGGTQQDTDMKWHTLFLKGIELLITAIERFRKYAPVKTFYVASNHSRQIDYYALCTLNAWFRNCDDVEVDTDPSPRYYVRYGTNLIGFAHSYYEKKQNLPHLMQIEKPSDWGETKYREYHLAHYHSEKVEEKGGIIFRWLPSITGIDTWSNDCGYIGAVKRSYSFIYDKDRGLIQMNSTIID